MAADVIGEVLFFSPEYTLVDGQLRLRTAVAIRGHRGKEILMLSVYVLYVTHFGKGDTTVHFMAARTFLPRNTPKEEQMRMLQVMTDLYAVRAGRDYHVYLEATPIHPKENENGI